MHSYAGSRRLGKYWLWPILALFLILVLVVTTFGTGVIVSPLAGTITSFSFGTAGDWDNNSHTTSNWQSLGSSGVNFALSLGDMLYAQPTPSANEQTWCNTFKANLANAEILVGNHETAEDNTTQGGGNIYKFIQYCPFTLGSLTGRYGFQYYFDYPSSSPLARFIMVDPNIWNGTSSSSAISYSNGTARQAWVGTAIDSARTLGITWVIVGTHKDCITTGANSCEIGQDFMRFLISKKVDIVLQGHDHNYQRSKQLICATSRPSTFPSNCISNDGSTGKYSKGAGTVFLIVGTGGAGPQSIVANADSPYFAKTFSGAYGYAKFTISTTAVQEQFVNTSGSTSTDSFSIGDFSMSANPASLALNQTMTGNSTITAASPDGFSGTVSLTTSVSPCPAGCPTTSFTPYSSLKLVVGGTNSTTMKVTTFGNTPQGNYNITVTGTSGSLSHKVLVTLRVGPPPLQDFSLAASPGTATANYNITAISTITVTGSGGLSTTVSLSSTQSPNSLACSLSPTSVIITAITPSATSTLSCKGTVAGNYAVTVSGSSSSPSLSHTVLVTIKVVDFSIATPASVTLTSGQGASSTISLGSQNGFTGTVAVSTSSSPTASGLVVSVDQSNVRLVANGSNSTHLTLSTNSSTPAGSYNILITGTSGSVIHQTSFIANVTWDFGISSSSSSLSLPAGSQTSATITLNSLGLTGNITLSASTSPSNLTVTTSFSSTTVSLSPGTSGSSSLTIRTTSSTFAQVYSITVTGLSDTRPALSHSVIVRVSVSSFNVTITPRSVTVIPGSKGTSTVAVTSQNGFTGSVSLTSSSSSGNLSCTLSPTGVSLGTTATSTLSCSGSPGLYVVTVTGTSGSLSRLGNVTYVVSDFSIGSIPASLNLGASGTTVVGLTSINNFVGSVTLTASASPSTGLTVTCPTSATLSANATTNTTCTLRSTVTGTYTVSFTRNVSATFHSASALIHVGDFTIIVSSPVNFNSGATGAFISVVLSSANNFAGGINVTSAVSPSSGLGVACPTALVSLTINGTASARCNLGSGARGTFVVTISGSGSPGTALHSASSTVKVGDFTITITGPVSFNSGSSSSFSISLASVSNFVGSVTLTPSNPPTAVTITCPSSPVSLNNTTANASCNVSSSSSGSYTVTIAGSGSPGTASHQASVTVRVGDFVIVASGRVNFNSGSSGAIISLSLNSTFSFSGSVSLVSSTTPSTGLTVSCQTSVSLSTNGTAIGSCDLNSTSPGVYIVIVTGSGSPGTATHRTSSTIHVGGFDLAVRPPTDFNNGGSGAVVTVSLNSTFDFVGSVSITSSPITGLTVNCPVSSISVSDNSTNTASCGLNSTLIGRYAVNITGTASPGTASHTGSAVVHVGGFTITPLGPTSFNLGASGISVTLSVTSNFDFTGTVTFSSSTSAPGILTISCNTPTITLNANATGNTSCGLSSSTEGTYAASFTGNGSPGTQSHTVTSTVHVGDFTVSFVNRMDFNSGASATLSVSLTSLNNFAGTVSFSHVEVPNTGLTVTCPAPPVSLAANVTATTPCTLTSAQARTYSSTITGRGSPGTSSHASIVTVHVGDFTISVLTVDINSGQTGQSVSITVTGTYNFTGTVGLAGSASPTGLAVNCSGPGISVSGNNSATSQCSLASTKAGTYVGFVTGAASPGSASHTASGTVHVGEFTINLVAKNFNVGQTGTSLNVTLSSTFNFAGGISLTASSTPSGLTINCPTTSVALAPNGTSNALCSLSSTTSNMYPTTISANGSPGTAFHVAGATVHVGDFAISVQSSTNINSGVTAAFTQATLTSKNNFAGTVSLAPTVTPNNGLSVSCSGGVLAENGTVVASCALGSSTPGTYALTIASSGSPGSAAHSAFMTVHVGAPQITAPTSSSFSVGSSSLPLTVTSVNNFSGTVALSSAVKPVSGLTVTCPGQVSLSPNASTIASCGLSSTSIGTYDVTTTGAGSPGTATSAATISVSVGNFTITASNANLNVGQTDQSVNVTVTSVNFNGTITLQSSAQPSGFNVQCPTTALTVNASQTINVLCFVSSTSPGTYAVTITGVASLGGTSHSAAASVSVGDFSISLPPRVNFNIGQTGVPVNVILTSTFNFSGSVTINPSTASGLGITCPTSQALLTPNSAVTLTCSLNSASSGTYPLTITGVASTGSATHSAISTVHVGDFAFSSTTRVSMAPGSTGAVITVTVSSLNNFVGDITISTSTNPSTGLSVNCPSRVSLLENLTIQFSCGLSSGTPGTYNVTLTGVGSPGTSSHLSSTIVQVGDYVISTPKPSISFNSGASGAVIPVNLTSKSFDDSVRLSSSIIPANGLSITCPSSPVGLTSNNTFTTSCSLGSSAPGTYLATITGVSSLGSITHSFNVTLHVGDFSISASSPAAAQAGTSATSTITLASSSFNGSVSVRISPPTGLSCNPLTTSGQLAANATSSIPLSCSSSKAGTFNVPMTATGLPGTSSHAASATFTFVDFNMTSTPSVVPPLLPNAVGNSTITIRSLNGFTGTVDLVASISPASGFVCTLTPASVGVTPLPPGNSNSTLSCSGSAGLYTVTVTGTSGSLSHTTTVSYTVQDFTVAASPTSLRVNAGTPGNSTIAVTSLNGYSGTVVLTAAIAPGSGLTCSFTPGSVILGTSSSSTLSCKGSAATYNVNVTGTSGSLSHSVLVIYTVQDFTVTASPSSITVLAGAVGSSTINVTSVNGFTGTVALTNSTSPSSGLTCSFSTTSINLGTSGTATLSCRGIARTFTVTVTATSDSLSRAATVTFTVTDYNFTASPTTPTLIAGSTGTSTISVSPINGFTGSVALSTAPSTGLTASLDIPSITTSGTAQLTLGASSGGNYTVTVTGRSGTLSHSVIISVIVSDFSVTASNSVSFNSGASNPQTGITITAINHLTGSITLLPSVSPPGLTVTGCAPNPVTLNSTVTSTISTCAFRSSTPGTYTVTMKV